MSKETVVYKKKTLKLWVKVFLCCLFIFYAFIGGMFIYKGSKPELIAGDSFTYRRNENVDYKVYLQENEFYEEKYMPKGKQYPSAIIDYVDIDLSYEYQGSKASDLKYSYVVDGTIIGNYENTSNGKSELWTKKYELVSYVEEQLVNRSSFTISKNIKINYPEYNKVVADFKNNFRLAIDAYLNVKMTVKVEGSTEGIDEKIDDVDVIEINIPLNSSTIKIETKYNPTISKLVENEYTKKYNMFLTYAGVVLLILVILIFLMSAKRIFYSSKTEYHKTYSRIMKNYSEIIVEIEDLPSLDDLEIIDVTNFDDMIDLEEELKSPILHKEIISRKTRKTIFLIIVDSYAYRFILEEE